VQSSILRTWQKKFARPRRTQGHGIGFQMNTTGNDSNALFDYFLAAYWRPQPRHPDGNCTSTIRRSKKGDQVADLPDDRLQGWFCFLRERINWNDADDNNASTRNRS